VIFSFALNFTINHYKFVLSVSIWGVCSFVLFSFIVFIMKKLGFLHQNQILKNKNFLFITLAQFCALYEYWTAVTWGATFFHEERGISMQLAGLFVAIVGISAILPSLFIGRISDKFGRKK